MQTNEKISHIMSELGLDPSDEKNRKIIERLLEAKPDVPVDARFLAQLRDEIQARANQTFSHSNPVTNLISNFMNKILASALVVMIALAAGGLWYIQNRTDQPLFQTQSDNTGQLLSGKYAVTGVAEESFGELSKVSIVNSSMSAEKRSAAPASPSASPSMSVGGTGGGSAPATMPGSEDAKMIAPGEPYPADFTFEYDGQALPQLPASQSVLKRTKPVQPASLVSRVLNMLSFGLLDLGKFQDMKMQYFAFMEDREYGYGLNVDMNLGTVSINQNWERWPQPQQEVCANGAPGGYCGPQPRITEKDIPADEDVFRVTNNFLTEYSIARDAYGPPEVTQNQWRIMYDQAPDKANFYFPEQVNVVYPLMLEGQKVLDEGGTPSGLNVMYDIRSKRVISVYDLTTKQFEKSQYSGVTDSKKVLEVATAGGFRNYTYGQKGPNTKVLKLGTPSLQLVKMWYNDSPAAQYGYGGGSELYVPAMVFPIKDWQKNNYWRSSVIVPLVKDVLESEVRPQEKPMPVEPDGGIGNTEPAVMSAPTPKNQ